MPGAVPHRAGAREWAGLAVLALPAMLVTMDLTVLHLAVPHLAADLQPSSTQLLWITDVYGFLIGGFLITMGSLGDRIGRRRLLLLGAAAFGVASVVAAFSSSAEMLIAARAALGVAGATLMPSTMSLIRTMFLDSTQRTTAISVWAMSFMVGGAIGPLVGGALLEHFWWGSVFLVGVPVMALLLVLGPMLLPEYRADHAGPLDVPSAGLLLATALPAIYGIKELARGGPAAPAVGAVALGVVVGLLFVRRQRLLAEPLIDVALFRNVAFGVSLGVMTTSTFVMMGLNLFVMQYLQLVHGFTPWLAGVWSLPFAVAGVLGMVLTPVLVRRIRPAFLIGGGLLVGAAGILAFVQAAPGTGIAPIVAGTALMGAGFAPAAALGIDLVIGAAPPERAGAASAMSETANELGGAAGLAVLGSIGTAVYRHDLADLPGEVPAPVAEAVRDTLAGALGVAGELPGPLAETVAAASRSAFTAGFHAASIVGAVLAAAAGVAAAVLLRRVDSQPTPQDGGTGPAQEDAAPAREAADVTT